MKKGTKSFGGFIVVTLSAILIIAAIVAAAFYNEVVIPEPETQAIAAGEEYAHGSYIGRTPSGNDVTTGEQLVSAINDNNHVNLLNDVSIPSGSFGSIAVYSRTIYGNGHKITIDVPDSSGKNDRGRKFFGGLMGELKNGGAIYDCTFDIGSGDYKGGYNADTFFGAVTGSIYNATVENVTVNIKSGTDFRIYCHSTNQRVGIGMLSGYAGNATIRNVTINNNGGTYRAGYSNEAYTEIYTDANPSTVANLVSFYEENTSNTLENIIIKGSTSSTTFNGEFASNLGVLTSGATVSVGNYYNNFRGTFSAKYGACAAFARLDGGSATIETYFEYYDSKSATVTGYGNYNATFTEKLSVRSTGNYANMQILFDPNVSASDDGNSLVLLFNNQSEPSDVIRTWTVSSTGRSFTGTFIGSGNFNDTGEEIGTVIFADLPIADIWNAHNWTADSGFDDGYFEANLRFTNLTKEDDLTEYEHGYVEGHNSSTTGTALNNTNFESELNNSKNSNSGVTKTYHLTSDILVSGFTNRTLSSVNLDGNGYTIYITGTGSSLGGTDIGGLAGLLNDSTIKNLRIVVTESMTITATNAADSRYSGSKTLGIGILAGRITGNALVENVQVYIPKGITVTGTASNTDCSLGGLAGNMSGRGRVSNCTVQLDGTLYCRRSYPFVAGFVGNTEDPNFTKDGTDTIAFNYNNIIFKGAGYLSGQHTNTGGTEKLYVAAITITDQIGSYNGKWIDIDGFIYAFSDNPIPTTTEYSMYGFVTQNHNGDSSLTNASDSKPMGSYITASNIFTATSYTAVKKGNDKGNTYWDIPTNAKISGSVKDLDGSTVTPYFRPSSTTEYNAANITLVASALNWSGFELLKADGASTALSVDSGSDKVIDVAKTDAVSDRKITVIKFETVEIQFAAPNELSDLTYSGIGQDATANLVCGESTLENTPENTVYTLSYTENGNGASLSNRLPLTVGNYLVTITLNEDNNYFFYYNGAASKTYEGINLTMNKALVPFGVNLGNASLTYTASEQTGDPSVIIDTRYDKVKYEHLLDDLDTVKFTYTPSGVSSPLSGNPTNAGTYTVSFTYTNTANVGILNDEITTATLTIDPKQVELGTESVEKTFASDSGAITKANVNANATYGLTINGFIDSDTNAAYTVSLASPSPVYIAENGTSTEYLAADKYTLTVTLSSPNYTFGTTSGENTDTVTVNVGQGANSVSTKYSRADWEYYNTPSAENFQMRFGTPTFSYRNTTTEQVFDSMTSTSPVGTYNVTVTVAETTSYSAFEQTFSGVFEITALPVSITLTAQDAVYSAKQYAESNITVSLDGSYTATDVEAILGEITWNVTGENHTEPNMLPTDAGTYTLGIAKVGNAENIDVDLTNVSDEFVISPRAVAFNAATPGGTNLGYGSAADPMSVVTVSAVIPEGFESDFTADDWSWNAVFEEGYGASTAVNTKVTLTVSVTITDDNYTAQLDQSEFEFTVVQATLTLRVEGFGTLENGASGWIYDRTAHELTVSVPDDLEAEVVLTYYTVSDGSYTAIEGNIAPTDAGNYAVTASISGDTNYADVTSEYFKYTIQKAQMVIEVTMNGWTYNGNAGTAAVVSGQKENPETTVTYIGTPNGGTTDEYNSPDVPTNAGSYRVVVSVKDTANYFGVSETVVQFTVERAALSDLSVSVEGWTYDATEHYIRNAPENGTVITPVVENNSGSGNVSYTWYSVSGEQQVALTTDYIRNAGKYRVTATVAQTNNYLEGTASHDFTVAKHEVTVKTAPYEFAYGVLTTTNANNANNYPGAVTGFLGGEADSSFELSLGYTSGQVTDIYVNAGEYDLTVTLIDDGATNYAFNIDGTLSGTATIPVHITQTNNSTTSGYSRSGWIYYDSPSLDETLPEFRFGSEAAIEVKYYTDPERQNEYKDGFTYVTAAGTYYVAVTMPGTDNYNELTVYGQFTVAQREVTIKVDDISKNTYYYGDMIEPSATIPASGFGTDYIGTVSWTYKEADSQEDVWKALPNDGIFDVGTYTIRFNYTNTANVALKADSVIETTVTINRRAVEFTVSLEEGANIVYGMTLEAVRALVQIDDNGTELVYGSEIEVMTGETEYSEKVNADTAVSITVKITVNDPNYTATVSGETKYELTVAKRAVTIAVDETATMLHANYNQFDPTPFYGHIRIEGLLNGDVKENVFNITLPVVSDTPTTDTYKVNVSLNTDFEGYANYEFGETTKWVIWLTLSAREFTFTVTMPESFVYGKEIDGMKLTIVQPEGEEEIPSSVLHQPMTFRYIGVDGTEYDSDIAPVNVGKYKLTVTITGTADYHSEPATSNVFEITPAPLTMTIDAAAGGLSATYAPNTEITDFMAAFAGYFKVAFPTNGAYTDEFGDIFSLSATKDNEGAVESIKNAGAYKLTPTLKNKNYSITDIPSLTYTVNKADMIVTVSVANWVYGEYSSKINAPVISGIMEDADLLEGYSVVYTLTSDESDTPIENIAAEDVGNYTVTVTVPATDNYNGTTVEATFDITKTTFESAVTITGWTYGEEPNAPSVTNNPGNADVRYTYTGRDGTEYAESDLVPVNAGYYTVTAYIDGSVNYEALEVSCNFAIDKASVSPAIDAELSKTYDGDAVAFTLTEGSNPGMGEVTYVIEREISGEYVTVTEARYSGNYRVRATVSETANYNGATTGYVTFAIGQKAVTASWSVADSALVYGDGYDEALALILIDKEAVLAQFAAGDGEYVEFILAATVADGSDYSERVNAGTTVTFGLSIAFAEGTAQDIVGSYSISVTGAGSKTVAPRSIEITAKDTSDIYGSSFTADGSLAEYFAENFTYNGTSVNAIADEYTTVEFAVNGTSGAAIPNAGTYTVTVTVGGNYTGAASAAYTIEQKTVTVAAGYELPFGVLNAENIAEYGYEALLGGFVGDESVDYTVRADDELGDEDSSFGFLNIGEYVLTVEIAENTNYKFETGYTAKFTVNIEKTDNAWIVEYARGDWTYLSEPAAVTSPEARFAQSDIDVRYYADSGYTVEMAPEAFTGATPAGTYYVTVSVPGSDNFNALRAEYSFEIYRLRAEMEVSTPEAVYDGEPYDGLTYTVSGAAADVVGEIGWMYIGEGMSDYVPGLPVDAGSYAVRIASVENLSIDIINITETFALVIDPATVNFTVRIASGMSVTYGDEITNAAAFVNTPVPDIDVGEFTYTVTAYNSRGALYTSGLQAGEQVSFVVEVTIEDTNYVANVRSTPSLTVRRLALEPEIVVGDETVTHGDEISVSNGSEFLVIDAITRYMADNGVRYYEYAIYVNGARYTTDYAFTPGEYEISVAIDGNFSGELRLTVNVDGNPELSVASAEPETAIGRFLDSINLSVAGAVAILLGFMVSLVVCLLIGLRKRGSE